MADKHKRGISRRRFLGGLFASIPFGRRALAEEPPLPPKMPFPPPQTFPIKERNPNAAFYPEPFHDRLLKLYKSKELHQDPFSISKEEFYYLEQLVFDALRKKQKDRSQMQEDFILFFTIIKYPNYYHYETKQKIEQYAEEGMFAQDFPALIERIPNKSETFDERTQSIHFRKINPTLAHSLFDLAQQEDINLPPKVLFTIALIENNFGNTTTSHQGALGALQTTRETVRLMDRLYGGDKNYRKRKRDHGEFIVAGIYNVKYLRDELQLSLFYNKPMDYIDYLALMIAYNKGLNNLIGDLQKTLMQINGGEALGYVRKAKAALQMNFSY